MLPVNGRDDLDLTLSDRPRTIFFTTAQAIRETNQFRHFFLMAQSLHT